MGHGELDAPRVLDCHAPPEIRGAVEWLTREGENVEAYIVGLALEVLGEDSGACLGSGFGEASLSIVSVRRGGDVDYCPKQRAERRVSTLGIDVTHRVMRDLV